MLEAALASGVDIRVASPVSSLVEKNGRICGVVMTIGERQFTIGARLGVLINAGGFAQNSRMRSRYMADGSTRWTAAGASDSGEMIEEMPRLGAARSAEHKSELQSLMRNSYAVFGEKQQNETNTN